jgi:hypothetical protein
MFGGYIDASNTHQAGDLLAVVGCAANTGGWIYWETKWRELLTFAGLARWHHTDFVNKKKRPTSNRKAVVTWQENEWLLARELLCDAFERVKPACFGATIWKKDYDELRKHYSFAPSDPYYYLLDRCFHRLIQGLFEHPKDEGVLIHCDQDKDEELVLQLAEWHTAFLRADTTLFKDRSRQIEIAVGSNLTYLPLQAADVVAHEVMRYATTHPTIPFIPSNQPTGSWILDRLRASSLFLVECLTADMLRMELDGSAFVAGNEPGFRFIPRSGGAGS